MIDPVEAGSCLTVIYRADNEMPEGHMIEASNGIDILFQDEWIVLASKPADLLTHPSFLGETRALTTLLSTYTLHPVSRLDRDTSGLIILAKNGYAHDRFAQAEVRKHYYALVHGRMPEQAAMIDAPIGRSEGSIITREVRLDGQTAQTSYRVCATASYSTQTPELKDINYETTIYQLLELELHTGRTHQIRVHCKHLGHPLLGDDLYLNGNLRAADRVMARQALHAYALSFNHPITGQAIRIEADFPDDMKQFMHRSELIEGSWPELSNKLIIDDLRIADESP